MFELQEGADEGRIRQEAILDDANGAWLTSRINRSPLANPAPVRNSVIIKDDTIRSGANTAGVYATNPQKLRIAEQLEAAGVVEIEAGSGTLAEHLEFVRDLKRSGSTLRAATHCHLFAPQWKDQVERSLEAGADLVNFVGMAGYLQPLGLHPDLVGDAVTERIQEVCEYTTELGSFIAIGVTFSTLHDFEHAIRAALAGGAGRFYIYDGRGWHTPGAMRFLTTFAREVAGDRMEIAIHCHDDYGLATANTVEAALAGADVVDCTILRTGHRCGNASLEQVVACLESIHDVRTGLHLNQLRELCQFVAGEYGLSIPANAPVVGKNMYTYGGIHVTALLSGHWYIWENIKAEAVGHERNIVFGITALQRTGASPVMLKISQMGYEPSDDQVETIFDRLHKLLETKREASVDELETVVRSVMATVA